MKPGKIVRRNSQAGFTLIELVIATAIGLVVMSALTSVVLTTVIADNTAIAHVEASSQVRNFQFNAYDDPRRPVVARRAPRAQRRTSPSRAARFPTRWAVWRSLTPFGTPGTPASRR